MWVNQWNIVMIIVMGHLNEESLKFRKIGSVMILETERDHIKAS